MLVGLIWRIVWLWLLFGLFGFCVFFIVIEEVVSVIWGENLDSFLESDMFEYIVILVLVFGFVVFGFEVW